MRNENYICFLDLLGIKDLAKYDPLLYFLAMEKFRMCIIESSSHFKNPSRIVFFSDSAFIQADSFQELFNFLRAFRRKIMFDVDKNHIYFFSAAVSIGNLEIEFCGNKTIINNELSEPNSIYSEKLNNILRFMRSDTISPATDISGFVFLSPDVSKVYVSQSSFKGIGIYIGREVLETIKIFLMMKLKMN